MCPTTRTLQLHIHITVSLVITLQVMDICRSVLPLLQMLTLPGYLEVLWTTNVGKIYKKNGEKIVKIPTIIYALKLIFFITFYDLLEITGNLLIEVILTKRLSVCPTDGWILIILDNVSLHNVRSLHTHLHRYNIIFFITSLTMPESECCRKYELIILKRSFEQFKNS